MPVMKRLNGGEWLGHGPRWPWVGSEFVCWLDHHTLQYRQVTYHLTVYYIFEMLYNYCSYQLYYILHTK